jgi:hypothetical protein
MDNAFEYIINNGGLASEADYSYAGSDGTCKVHAAKHGQHVMRLLPSLSYFMSLILLCR